MSNSYYNKTFENFEFMKTIEQSNKLPSPFREMHIVHISQEYFWYSKFCALKFEKSIFLRVAGNEIRTLRKSRTQYNEWTAGSLSSATCSLMFMQFTGWAMPTNISLGGGGGAKKFWASL